MAVNDYCDSLAVNAAFWRFYSFLRQGLWGVVTAVLLSLLCGLLRITSLSGVEMFGVQHSNNKAAFTLWENHIRILSELKPYNTR